jgi:hypothetical protein
MTYLLKEKRAKGIYTLKHKKGKRQPSKEKASRFEKKVHLLSAPEVVVAEGKGCEADEGVDE